MQFPIFIFGFTAAVMGLRQFGDPLNECSTFNVSTNTLLYPKSLKSTLSLPQEANRFILSRTVREIKCAAVSSKFYHFSLR
jgi:hypothetical protein